MDFDDLGFDRAGHQEALKAFAALHLSDSGIKPALRARQRIYFVSPGVLFFISRFCEERSGESREIIYEGKEESEAEAVRSEVERYFQRHFPGRYLTDARLTDGLSAAGKTVYVVYQTPQE